MNEDWKDLSILERRRLINAAYANKDLSSLKIEEIDLHHGKLRIKVGKHWFSQKISAVANLPQLTGNIDKKTQTVSIPAQSLNVRINVSWE